MGQPAYQAVASTLRTEIERGRWAPGERLPTQQELCERFEVSRNTARQAIEVLVRENLVFTQTSRGTIVRSRQVLDYVATRPLRNDRKASGYDVFVETVHAAGRVPSKQFSFGIQVPPVETQRRLGIREDELAVKREVMQFVDDEPWSWEVSFFPLDIAKETGIDSPHDIAEGTTRRLKDRGFGETAWMDENQPHPASPEEAHALAVPGGTWISDLTRTGATHQRVTRATRIRRIAERNRTIHELGDDTGLTVIRETRVQGQ